MSLIPDKNMDSVFDNCTKEEIEFDAIFDEDDDLADAVCGCNENGDSLLADDEDLHNTEDEAKASDFEFNPDNLQGAKKSDIEGAEKNEIEDSDKEFKDGESDIDKFLDAENREDDYAEGKADGNIDAAKVDTVTKEIEKDNDIMSECDDFSIDCAIDPNSAPSDTGSDKEAPVAGETPSDKGEGKPADVKPNDDYSVEGDDNYQKTDDASVKEDANETSEDIDAELDAPSDAGDPEVEECGGSCGTAKGVKEDATIDDLLDDEVAADDDTEGEASIDLSYDPSDEDIIDMVIGQAE